MNKILAASIIAGALISSLLYGSNLKDSFQYISPLPDAKLVSKETTIILRPGGLLAVGQNDLNSLARISGSASGIHSYDALISDDRKTVILKPHRSFALGEVVTVTVERSLRAVDGSSSNTGSYSFTVSPKTGRLLSDEQWREIYAEFFPATESNYEYKPTGKLVLDNGVAVPSDFPQMVVSTVDDPDSGYIFLGTIYGGSPHYLMIMNNNGEAVYYKKLPDEGLNFSKLPNGLLSFFMYDFDHYFFIDSTYAIVDSIQCGNGYGAYTDMHDLEYLPDGHYFIMAYDPQIVDMSQIVPGGRTNATVIGLIVQELDTLKNVVFEWRSWDHFEITDATYDINLRATSIDYCHGNTTELDYDGNLIISCRNMDEITKINRQTGDIIWRLGGENNQFTFINDPRGFSHQHDIRRQESGNITLFDNGNLFLPRYSRALEYQIDEVNKTVTLVWEYRNSPDEYGSVMGNAQRLSNGNTLIGWGADHPNVTEVRPDSTEAFEMEYAGAGIISYRAFRFPWHGMAPVPQLILEVDTQLDLIRLVFNKFGDGSIVKYYVYADTQPEPTVIIDSTTATEYYVDDFTPARLYFFRITAVDSLNNESPFSNELYAVMPGSPDWLYIPGDVNGDRHVLGSDVTYGLAFLLGEGPPPPDSIWWEDVERWVYAAADANGDCRFFGSDITYLIQYFLGAYLVVTYCPETPPQRP